jgi:hypothetical protein
LLQNRSRGLYGRPRQHRRFEVIPVRRSFAILAACIAVEFKDQCHKKSEDEDREQESDASLIMPWRKIRF